MKEALKRIQKTLDQLEALKQSTAVPTTNRPISFQISPVVPIDLPPSPVPKGDRLTGLPQLFPVSQDESSVTEAKMAKAEPLRSAKTFDLEQVIQRIQALYYEGPIVNAWIDSVSGSESSNENEVEEIVFERPDLAKTEVSEAADSSILSSYRVCGIDELGQQWSYHCPVDQLLELSVAIARYRKLQELLAQKQQLEAQIQSNAIAAENDKS